MLANRIAQIHVTPPTLPATGPMLPLGRETPRATSEIYPPDTHVGKTLAHFHFDFSDVSCPWDILADGCERPLETDMDVSAKIPRVLTRPGCHKHLRWSGGQPAPVRCPGSWARIIAFVGSSGECEAVIENDDSVAQMLTDWLKPNRDDEVDFSPETASTGNAPSETAGAADVTGAPNVPPNLVASPDDVGGAHAGVQPADEAGRKAG